MNNDIFQKGIENLKNIKMSEDEKAEMRNNLSVYINNNPLNPVKTPSPYFSFFSFNVRRSFVMVSVLVLIFGVSGTAVFASEESLPGDLLYPVKVKITEPLVGVVTFNKNAKINWEAKKANRRLKEAENLVQQNRLNTKSIQEIESRFNEHAENFNKLAEQEDNRIRVEKSSNDDQEKIENTRLEFESDVSEHTNNLEKMKERLSPEKKEEVESFKKAILKKIEDKKQEKMNKKNKLNEQEDND
jgi:hypothetical protein